MSSNKKPNAVQPTEAKVESASTEMVVVTEGAQLPAYLQNQQQSRGSEAVSTDDLVIPRLEIVQALSPARKRTEPEYIDGAEEGDLFNTVTRELYGDHVWIVPVLFRKDWNVWLNRKKHGNEPGFLGSFPTLEQAEARKAEAEDSEQYAGKEIEVIETPVNFSLLIHPVTGKVEEIAVSMARTKYKVARKWNSLIRLAGGDRFSRVYKITTVEEKNAKGDSYLNFAVQNHGFPAEKLYRRAEALYNEITSGARVVTADATGDLDPPVSSDSGAEM